MASYIKQLKDSNKVDNYYPRTLAEAVYMDDLSTTVQVAMEEKADLESPAFTGEPTAPTPVEGDSSTKIATTEFVQNALQSGAGESGTTVVVSDTDPGDTLKIGDFWYKIIN